MKLTRCWYTDHVVLIYLDYNASTPVDPSVAAAMRALLEDHFGNPSSGHWVGSGAKAALDEARRQVAALLGADTDEIVFTGGGSEAVNLALKGVAWALRAKGALVVTSAVEHPAILGPCRFLERQGFAVSIVPVDRFGRVDPDDVARAITPQTVLVSIMHANNEVGTIQPIGEIGRIARAAAIAAAISCIVTQRWFFATARTFRCSGGFPLFAFHSLAGEAL